MGINCANSFKVISIKPIQQAQKIIFLLNRWRHLEKNKSAPNGIKKALIKLGATSFDKLKNKGN